MGDCSMFSPDKLFMQVYTPVQNIRFYHLLETGVNKVETTSPRTIHWHRILDRHFTITSPLKVLDPSFKHTSNLEHVLKLFLLLSLVTLGTVVLE